MDGEMRRHTDVVGSEVKLKKQLGLHSGVAFIVGIVVGSGIFVSPKGVLLEAGSVGLSIIVWALCGLITLTGAMCYAELGTCIPNSGADYAYITEIFGGFPAFLYLWVALIIIIPTGNAITALTFANYTLQPLFPDCGSPAMAVSLVGAACVAFLTFINCANVKWAARVQNVFTVTKVLALLIIIVTGFVMIGKGEVENFKKPFLDTTTDVGRIALSFYSGLYSYSGWNYLNFVTEELKNPYKNLPRAIWISVPFVTMIYVLTNIAYFTVLSPAELLASDAVAMSFSVRTHGVMSWIMSVFVACSTFGGLNGAIFTSSRLCFVGARKGHFPNFLAMINVKYFTPVPSILFGGTVAIIYLSIGDVYALINYMTFVESLFYGLTVAGLLYYRLTRPKMKRPIKINIIFPIFYMCICLFLIITSLTSSPWECLIGIVVLCTGIPVYVIGVMWTKKPKPLKEVLGRFTVLVQKLCLCMPEEEHGD